MLGVTDNKFTIGKEVYYPFAVEMHYFRVEKKYWSICFERIRKAGFRIISTCVPWNLHQDRNKDIDFSGYMDPRKDLVVFLELAREFGFKVILRPGPRIGGQWLNGGLPHFLFNDLKIFARDAKGQELKLPADSGVEGGYLPSYMHPHFQHFLRNYFKAFVETTKNYIHPRGPIFMVELDFETSFGHNLHPGSADYNPDVIAKYYPGFLTTRYDDIKKLNRHYREDNAVFEAVEPPRNFSDLDIKDLPKIFDWFRFREFLLDAYLASLEDIFKSYTVAPLFFRSLYFHPGDLLPAFNLKASERDSMVGTNVFPEGTYLDLAQKGKYLKGEHGFAWAASFISGLSDAENGSKALEDKYPDGLRRFYLIAGVTNGFKGYNHYMFVKRDHWAGAPLANDGTITSGYEVIKKFNAAILDAKLNELESAASVCVIGNRHYQWLRQLERPKQFDYIQSLLVDSSGGVCRDLKRLKIDYDIRETINPEELKKYSLVFIPSAEFMPEAMQDAIIEMLKQGINIILCGLMPKFDENFKECQNLSRHLRLKTTLGSGIDFVQHKSGQFSAYVYGNVLATDPKVKKLATANKKAVAVAVSKYKGTLFFFSFDMGSGGDHNKMAFLEDHILTECGLSSYMYCSDPSIDMAVFKAEKRVVLALVAPPAGELPALADISTRDIIVRLDLRKIGMVSAKVKMKDLFGEEGEGSLKIAADTLRKGIPLRISYPDGRMFLIEKQ